MILITFLFRASTGILSKEVFNFTDHITDPETLIMSTNFRNNVQATILLLSVDKHSAHVCYLVVSCLLPLVAKYAIYRDS